MPIVPIQGNAADARQVKRAARIERERAEDELADLAAVLKTPAGLRLLWRWLGKLGVLTLGAYDDNPYRMAALVGQREKGLELLAEIEAADDEAFDRMRAIARQRTRAEASQAEAARATGTGETPGE